MTKTHFIDLSSDTASKPTGGMYQAMISADVGDEQKRADPSVNALCEKVAGLLGKEAAVFLPSGVMCNLIGILVQCDRGDEIITGAQSHVLNMEGGAPAALAGVVIRPLDGPRGMFSSDDVRQAIRYSPKKNIARTALISIEQSCNRGGGGIWPLETIIEISQIAREHSIAMHMDGARLLNASVASGISPAEYAARFDTVWIDMSKGLGCPVGAVLTGTDELIEEAWVWKHRLGGAMRQAGVLAAAGLYALDRYTQQLSVDHDHASRLAAGLLNLPGIRLKWGEPETNMVFFDVAETGITAEELSQRLGQQAVSIGVESEYEMRAVTHVGVSGTDIDRAIDLIDRTIRANPSS